MKYLSFLILMLSISASASVIKTKTATIRVDTLCPEGFVACEFVSYFHKDNATNKTTQLFGEAVHTTCADGVSPCRFMGYRFEGAETWIMISDVEKWTMVSDAVDGVNIKVTEKSTGKVLTTEYGQRVEEENSINPECHASKAVVIDMVPGNKKYAYKYWLLGQFDGKPCEESTLTLSVVDVSNKKVLFDMTHTFKLLTFYDDYRPDQFIEVANNKLDSYVAQGAVAIEWPAYEFSSTQDAPSINEEITALEKQIAQIDPASFETDDDSIYASPAEQEYSGLFSKLDDLNSFYLEFGITRKQYERLKRSGAVLFEFVSASGEGRRTAFALDVKTGKVLKISS